MSLSGANILLIADEGEEKLGLSQALTDAKANPFVARSLSNALWYIDGAKFQLVVVTTKAKKDGALDTIRAVRANKRSAKTPIVLLCEAADADFVQRASASGVVSIFTPPFELKTLVDKLAQGINPPKKASGYDVRLINCFLDAIREVMVFYLGGTTQIGKPGLKSAAESNAYVTGLIAFNGQGQMGSMSLSFDLKSISHLAKKVFGQDDIKLDPAGIADLAGELCNQVLGRTKANFLNLGLKMQIGLPEVVVGEKHVVFHKTNNPVITVLVTHPDASCGMEFSIGEGVEEDIAPAEAEASASGVILFD
jgi:CheY-specific phosphatase CheX/ActR/RegA family two-component response regulator